ncbi:peptidase M15 [Flavobacteriaceae bacterium R38]|nr:peptidase M15 [Flavobacteriaceae bacterium R38]
MKTSLITLFFLLFLFTACKHCKDLDAFGNAAVEKPDEVVKDTIREAIPDTIPEVEENKVFIEDLADTTFIRLKDFNTDFVYDLKYATVDNFLKKVIYDCAECYTRVKTAKALIKANTELISKGYHIKFFDCYRPLDAQKKLWEILPNPQYVANPKKGSIHNRGGAVDITLVDQEGNELDMGTPFDFFGRKAYHDYFEHSDTVLANRKLLKETMEKYGFRSVRSEWWHYNFSGASKDRVANFKWKCE